MRPLKTPKTRNYKLSTCDETKKSEEVNLVKLDEQDQKVEEEEQSEKIDEKVKKSDGKLKCFFFLNRRKIKMLMCHLKNAN